MMRDARGWRSYRYVARFESEVERRASVALYLPDSEEAEQDGVG